MKTEKKVILQFKERITITECKYIIRGKKTVIVIDGILKDFLENLRVSLKEHFINLTPARNDNDNQNGRKLARMRRTEQTIYIIDSIKRKSVSITTAYFR